MDLPTVLVVGEIRHAEMASVWAVLDARAQLMEVVDAAAASKWLASARRQPVLLVVVERRPGEFSPAEFDGLLRMAPLIRTVRLLGSWCEGELRTGRPWPMAARCYWHQAAAWLSQELDRESDGRCPAWGLPLAATDEDRRLTPLSARRSLESATRRGVIAIRSRDYETADMLADLCEAAGWTALPLRSESSMSVRRVAACLWDLWCDPLSGDESLALWHGACPGVPIIALASFPRIQDAQWATARGI